MTFALLSALAGIVPEIIFFVVIFVISKDVKKDIGRLFAGMAIVYFLSVVFLAFTPWKNFILIFGLWGVARLVCKSEPIDVFLITSTTLIMLVVDLTCYFAIQNYIVAMIMSRIALIGISFAWRSFGRRLYMRYASLWNRRDDGQIKSITLRGVSFIALNIELCVLMFIAIRCQDYIM